MDDCNKGPPDAFVEIVLCFGIAKEETKRKLKNRTCHFFPLEIKGIRENSVNFGSWIADSNVTARRSWTDWIDRGESGNITDKLPVYRCHTFVLKTFSLSSYVKSLIESIGSPKIVVYVINQLGRVFWSITSATATSVQFRYHMELVEFNLFTMFAIGFRLSPLPDGTLGMPAIVLWTAARRTLSFALYDEPNGIFYVCSTRV